MADKYVKNGYVREALQAVEVDFFGRGGERCSIFVDSENQRSVNVAEKSGYKLDGILRHARWSNYFGEFRDLKVFSKLSSEQ